MTENLKKCPKTGVKFKKYWKIFIDDVISRDNFCKGHLLKLEILCDLLIQYEEISKEVKETGYTYQTEGRYGYQIKPNPAVATQQKIVAEIRNYFKALGLILNKVPDMPGEEINEWLD